MEHSEREQGEEIRSQRCHHCDCYCDLGQDCPPKLQGQGLVDHVRTLAEQWNPRRRCSRGPQAGSRSSVYVTSICECPVTFLGGMLFHLRATPMFATAELVPRFQTTFSKCGLRQPPTSGHPSDVPTTKVSLFLFWLIFSLFHSLKNSVGSPWRSRAGPETRA